MTEKRSIKAALSGVGVSSVSLLGVCGGGACAAACGVTYAAPVASLLGVSTAGLTTWTDNLLPVLTAISAVAFTIAYFSLFRNKNGSSGNDPESSGGGKRNQGWAKPAFWIGLALSIWFYGKAIANNVAPAPVEASSCVQKAAEETDAQTKSCSPSDIPADTDG